MHIVSFYAPRPEHPFFQDYTPFLALLRESCERHGHRHFVLTDDASVAGDAYVCDLPRSLMKAVLAAQLAFLSDPEFADEPTLLVGADCVLASDPQAFAGFDGDIVITVGNFADCRMNTGAIYVPRPGRVAAVWRAALAGCGDDWGDDQTSLYDEIRACGLRVRELPVDPWNLAPVHPGDDCTRGVVLHFRGPRKAWMIDYCHKWLGIGNGITVTALPNTTDNAVLANIRINSHRGLPELMPRDAHDGHAVLVGGGPSLADCIDEIKWRQEQGQTIFALNGTADLLLKRGIMPDFGVVLDARPDNARFIRPLPNGGVWLLASQCDPLVFEAARGLPGAIWHFPTPGIEAVLPECDPPQTMICGGLTVGLCVMSIAYTLGYRELHLYGYDSSDADGAAHAYAQGESDPERKRVKVWCAGREFTAGIAMYAQAEAFPRWAETLTDAGAAITVHGDGLLPHLARQMAAQQAATLSQGAMT